MVSLKTKHIATNKYLFVPIFNTNISHRLFYYKITFVNSQHENTNLKGDLFSKTFATLVLKISGIQKKYESKIYIIS